jgi:hypothetical protein
LALAAAFFKVAYAGDHFAGDQIFADAEVLKRALSLRAPEFVSRNIYFAEAVCFLANFRHFVFSFVYSSAWWPSFVDSSPSCGGIDPERARATYFRRAAQGIEERQCEPSACPRARRHLRDR